jgi:hypothetical protein
MCLYWKKVFFYRTSQLISIKFCANHHLVKRIQAYSSPLQKGDNKKNVKLGWGHHKFSSQELPNS